MKLNFLSLRFIYKDRPNLKILAIPEPNWSLDQLNLADIDLANAFIKNCGFHGQESEIIL